MLLKLYGSGFADQRALSFVNLYKYGGGFDMAAALAAKILPFDLFETRRLVGACVGIVGLIATWRIGRHLGGPIAGLIALVLLAACPLYYGHMFINAKDAPFAAAMAVLLLGLVRAFEEYPRLSARTVALTGIGLGLVFGSRILAGIVAPYFFAALLLIAAGEARSTGVRQSGARVGEFIWRILPALVLGYLIMGLLWPWSILEPLNPVRAAEYFDKFFEKPWRELFAGKIISVTAMPADYLPRLFVLKLPEIMLVLGLAGVAGALFAATQRQLPLSRRANFVLVTLAAILPILVAMLAHPAFYNGLRHFVFVVPPFAAIGGLAGAWIFERALALGTIATTVI
ncbi:MAG: glycosyltransferase family 39 protein, partial [Pseudolabrys sp.]